MSTDRPVRPEESGVVQALEARDFTLAASLGKYRLLGALGHGGMADVYLAVADGPEGFRKLCVLKLLKESMAEDEEFRAMFLDEARLAARLNHPNVVQTFEVGETHGRMMIAMEYVEGQPATRMRRRLRPEQFPLSAYIGVLCDVCEALDYAHRLTDYDGTQLGIVHRDVSPHNIIIGYDARVKLVDFGIAKSAAAMQETQAGVLKGKVGYMAPEQASMRAVDGRADVFSVGVILWEAIAGRRLAEGMAANDVLMRRIEGNDPKIADVVPEVDPELAAICDRAMARQPEDRFASAAELQLALEGWLEKHGQPSRKDWSKAIRDAFAPEREQLRALVEQRMADSSLSGARPSLRVATVPSAFPSSSRVLPTGESSVTPPTSKPPSASASLVRSGESSFPARTVSVDPAAQRRSAVPLFAVLGIGVLVALGIGATVYVVKSQAHAATDAPSSSSTESNPPPPVDTARAAAPSVSTSGVVTPPATPPSTATLPTTPVATTSPATPSRPNNNNRPAFVGPVGKLPPAVAHTATAAPPTTPTSQPGPAPTKPATRPLDEKDPYAP
jgi:serine/threonine-protein kinase